MIELLAQPTKRRSRRTLSVLSFFLLVSSVHSFCTPKPSLPRIPTTTKTKLSASVSSEPEIDKDPFELHIGRALDTLRNDYPKILTDDPDYSIYASHIEIIDPSGVQVHGLRNYKAAFGLIHALIKVLYCGERQKMTLKLCFDKARQNIRIHWNVQLEPRFSRKSLHYVDGISVYEFDKDSGKICQHRIENLLYNDTPVRPKEGVIALLRKEHRVTVPSYYQPSDTSTTSSMVQFQFHNHLNRESKLFAVDATKDDYPDDRPDMDWDALEAKNQSRKKFGLKPLTPEEFVELQAQVAQIADQQTKKAQQLQSQSSTTRADEPNFLDKLFGNVLKDTCESNFDCERPLVCCDFGFQKRCCSSGNLVGNNELEYATIPVPQGIEDFPQQRRRTL